MNETLFEAPQVQRTTDDYYTPKWLFERLATRFSIDVASPPEGIPWIPADRYFTMADDGLKQPWDGLVWMNPPYSNPSPWVARFIEHNNGIALLPFSKSKWCQSLWDSTAQMVYIYSLKFERIDRKVTGHTPFCLGLWAIGPQAITILKQAELGRVR